MLRKKGVALAISLAFPAASFALGLGAMKTSSQLSQPFAARIELLGASAGELDDIAIKLADASQFQRAGLALNAQLLALRFEVVNDPKGDYIKVYTRDPVNEPVLDFIVELRSPNGTMLREYAVLLDPPSYALRSAPPRPAAPAPKAVVAAPAPATPILKPVPAPAVARPAPVAAPAAQPAMPQPVVPPVAPPSPPGMAAAAPATQPAPTPVVSPEKAKAPRPSAAKPKPPTPEAVAKPKPALAPPPAEPPPEGEVALKSHETLWEVAKRYRPSADVSVPQMMIAIQRANPEAFPDNNVHNIRPGATLAIPDEESIASVSEAEADAEVHRQVARWRERRLAISSRPAPQTKPAEAAAPASMPKASPAKPAAAPASGKPAADARLEIVAPGAKADSKAEGALRDEHAAALASEMAEMRARLDEAAGIIDLLENQVKLKNEELTRMKQAPAAAAPVAPAAAGSTGNSATPPAEPAAITVPGNAPVTPKPAPPKEDVIQAPAESNTLLPPELVESVPGGWLGLGGVLAALLAGLGLAARRRRVKPESAAPVPEKQKPGRQWAALKWGTLLARVRKPSPPEPLDETPPPVALATSPPVASSVAAAAAALAPLALPAEADPLEEVNIYLAYERFDQAEELVRKVISEHPQNPDYQLRLLEVLQAAGNAGEFERAARSLRELVDENDPRWLDARAFWEEFDTGRELLAETASEISAPLVDKRAPEQMAEVHHEDLEATHTSLKHAGTAGAAGLKAEEALDELDALLGSATDLPRGSRDVLDLAQSSAAVEAEERAALAPAPEPQRAAAPVVPESAPVRVSPPRAPQPEVLAATELDFDLGSLDLGATGEVDLDVLSRAKATEAALDLRLDPEPESPPPVSVASSTPAPSGAADLDFDLDLGEASDGEPGLVDEAVEAAPAAAPEVEEFDFDLGSTVDGVASETEPSAVLPPPAVVELEDFDLSLEGDLAASLDLAAELGLKSPARSEPVNVPAPEPSFEPLPDLATTPDLDLSLDFEEEPGPVVGQTESQVMGQGFDLELESVDEEIEPDSLELGVVEVAQDEAPAEEEFAFGLDDETDTKLNLAKAYIELGEAEAARSILAEVVSDGEPAQREEAERLLSQIG